MRKKIIILFIFVIFSFAFASRILIVSADEITDSVLQINDEIQTKKDQIKELNDKIEKYQKLISDKQKEAATLTNQIDIINNQVEKLNLEIESAETETEELELEIDSLNQQILEMESKIKNDQDLLGNVINFLNKEEAKSDFEITFLYNSFSEFFDHLFYIQTLEGNLNDKIKEIAILKKQSEEQSTNLTTKKSSLETLHTKLRETKAKMQDQVFAKSYFLEKAKASEEQFRKMVNDLRQEQSQIDQEITSLETSFRKKLEITDKDFSSLGQDIILSWPLEPTRGISAYFHDPDYPFRYIYEHPAIDIRAYQGTPVKAAASGYVVKVVKPAYGNLSYVMLVHRAGFSTLYMHLSRTIVEENDFVDRGQLIGYSGGMPGTAGAGRMTTGPHLHFEVRLNSVPVDPMNYLLSY
jgi:murein DD-endopeptidase MepM/ murein hydrolase activator NlpD